MQLLPLLRKGYFYVFLGVSFLVLSFVPFHAFLPACVYWELRPAVANGDKLNIEIGFFVVRSFVRLNVHVYGGDNRILAYLMDSSNNIFDQELVNNSGTFCFRVPRNGYYSLYLDNDFNLLGGNDKQILAKVYYYLYHVVLLLSGLIISVSGIGLEVYNKLELKNGKEEKKINGFKKMSRLKTLIKRKRALTVVFLAGVSLLIIGIALWLYTDSVVQSHEQLLNHSNLTQQEIWRLEGSLQWWKTAKKTTYDPLAIILITIGVCAIEYPVIYTIAQS